MFMKPKNIVIVEDEFLIQELHKTYVEGIGHNVLACFSNGEETIEYFKYNDADIILMDLRLDGTLDGIQTIEEIQKTHSVPVIYISGNSEETNIKRAGNTNYVAFLTKPIIKEDIRSLI